MARVFLKRELAAHGVRRSVSFASMPEADAGRPSSAISQTPHCSYGNILVRAMLASGSAAMQNEMKVLRSHNQVEMAGC